MKQGKAEVNVAASTLLVLILLAGACAKVSTPTGGPRDRTAPVILETVPAYGVKNFHENKIVITFDEYVSLNNINEKFMVSPPLKKKPRVFTRGKNVIVEFDEKLRDSTTYTFYFQDAIRDLNEGNTIEDYQFVVGTGSVIDSLSVTGNVYLASNMETPEKTMVLLYRELADSFVVKHLPDYISRVDLKGYFRINNVKPGTYRLYALKDADNSKNYNHTDEDFAYMKFPVDITVERNYIPPVKDTVSRKEPPKEKEIKTRTKGTNQKKVVQPQDTIVPVGEFPLMLFTGPKTNHYLAGSGRPMKYQLVYTLSLPPDTMDFRLNIPGSTENSYFVEKSRERDTIRVWLTDSTLYAQSQLMTIIDYPFTDTLGFLGYRTDTIQMRFITPRQIRGTKPKKAVYAVESNLKGNTVKPGTRIFFGSQTPFRQPDTSAITFYMIKDSLKLPVPYKLTRDSASSLRYYFDTELKEDMKYVFIADTATFGNIYGQSADSAGYGFTVKKSDSYSSLTVSVKNCSGKSIIQLMNSKEQVIRESVISSDGKVVFPLLDAGTYRLKVIYDLNGDGKWTTGDFDFGIQPEPVSYYPREIDLKAGWVMDMDQDWDIGKQFQKPQKMKEKKTAKR